MDPFPALKQIELEIHARHFVCQTQLTLSEIRIILIRIPVNASETMTNSNEQKLSGESARLNMTINALLVLMTQFQAAPCAAKARHIARHLEALATHACADPIQRDLADGLCRHWLAICHGYCEISASDDLDDSRVLN